MKRLPSIDIQKELELDDEFNFDDFDDFDDLEFMSAKSDSLPQSPFDSGDEDFHNMEAHELLLDDLINFDYGEPLDDDMGMVINQFNSTGWIGNFHLDKIINEAILQGASDIDVLVEKYVTIKINGDSVRLTEMPIPTDNIMNALITEGMITQQALGQLNENLEYDGAYKVRYGPFEGRRLRVNIGLSFNSYFVSMRIINEEIPSFKDLGLEDDIMRWTSYPDGLVLLCGPTGAGKSTTLASVIRELQTTTRKKIITIEKPIEYIYPDDSQSIVVQREVGGDTRSFANGLTSAMRQAPNIIMIGEVRNTEEFRELMRASETGHLSVSTMHTNSVPTTLNRIQSFFEGGEQTRVLSVLADTLRGVGNQVLVKTKNGDTRFAVRELLTVNEEIRGYIEIGDINAVRDYQERHQITMEHGLARGIMSGKCTYEEAVKHTSRIEYLDFLLKK